MDRPPNNWPTPSPSNSSPTPTSSSIYTPAASASPCPPWPATGPKTPAPGRTISFAQSRNIPFLYTEARGAARIHPEDLAMMVRGMRNLLCHLSILDGVPEIPAPPRRLHGPGNTDAGMQTKTGGFLIPHVELLETVQEGQLLARVTDLHGRTLETLLAPRSGVVALRREMPAVSAGDTVCILAAEM
jgi:uncharacterized protein